MTTPKKLIFQLDQYNLDIYSNTIDLDNLIKTVSNFGEHINLSDIFGDIWSELEFCTDRVDSIDLIITDRAGFTNTRVIAIWGRTWSMFHFKPFNTYYNNQLVQKIHYSTKPRIG
jgi:hypothetical protein